MSEDNLLNKHKELLDKSRALIQDFDNFIQQLEKERASLVWI